VSTVTGSAWTAEDRALMLGWRMYRASLHEPCGHPKETAFHPDNNGEFEVEGWVTCWPCTEAALAEDPKARPVRFPIVVDTRDYAAKPLPPWPDPDDD
jgi:hypothetical protein